MRLAMVFASTLASITNLPAWSQDHACDERSLEPTYVEFWSAVDSDDAAGAIAIAKDIAADCNALPAALNAHYFGGLVANQTGDHQTAVALLSGLRGAEPDTFYPPVGWALMGSNAALEQTDAFRAARDAHIRLWLEAVQTNGVALLHDSIETDAGLIYALEFTAFDPERRQDFVFILAPAGDGWPHTVSLGAYAQTNAMHAEMTGGTGTLWHLDGYDCAGHVTLGFFEGDRPNFDEIKTAATAVLTGEAQDVASSLRLQGEARAACAFSHLVTPTPPVPDAEDAEHTRGQ